MLVMSRKINEAIQIGDVTIDVCKINGNRVTIGITAPKDVLVLRSELLELDNTLNGRESGK